MNARSSLIWLVTLFFLPACTDTAIVASGTTVELKIKTITTNTTTRGAVAFRFRFRFRAKSYSSDEN